MKAPFLYLMIAGFALSGCSQRQQLPETNFFRDFSLGQIVDRVQMPGLRRSTFADGSSTSPGETTDRRRDFDLTFVIEDQEGARFDESGFSNRLKEEIARALSAADVRVQGGGSSGSDSFYFDYSQKDHEGWLEVRGARVEGNKYKLWGVIREVAREAKQ